jgi:hypothetical protein
MVDQGFRHLRASRVMNTDKKHGFHSTHPALETLSIR